MEKKKSGVIKYVAIIVAIAVILCGFIALLLYRDSAKFATRQLALKYYEYITKDDAKGMEKLFIDVDRAEIVKAAESFDKYFDGIGRSLVSQYGAGYSVTIENFEYTELDTATRKELETAYDKTLSQAGLISFDITFASAPSAKLDGGKESEVVNKFRDNLVVIKADGDWYPAVSAALNNGISQRYFTALTVGDKSVSIAEYNFFYNMLSSGLSEGETLSDAEAISYVTEVYAMCAAAEKEGFKPEQKDVEDMEAQLAEIKKTASAFGDADEKYYSAYYGMGMTYDLLYDVYYAQLLMQSYISEITGQVNPTDKEMQTYYEKNKNLFDTVDFVYYEIYSGVEGSLSDATDRATQILANSSNVDEFKTQCKDVYDGLTESQKKLELYQKEAVIGEKFTYYDFQDAAFEFRDWVFSEARVEGDKKYFAIDSGDDKIGYIIVMAYMVSPRSRADYNTVNFMYATILTEKVKEEDALDKLTQAKDKWLSGEKTSESFGKIADEFYESESESEDGGSYVLIAKGDMVDAIDKWVFDEARKEGDCEIVKSTVGCHLIYFLGQDIPKWQVDVKNQMHYDAVSEVYEKTTREIGVKVLSIDIVMYC